LPLFIVAGVWCARVGDVLGAIHLYAFTLICSFWNEGRARVRPVRLGRWVALSVIATVGVLFLNHAVIERSIRGQEGALHLIARMGLTDEFVDIEVLESSGPHPAPRLEGETLLDRIRRTGELRVGFVDKTPPFAHRNAAEELVGFDIDLIQRFAWDLQVRLVLVPTPRSRVPHGLEQDHFDIATGGITSTIQTLDLYTESRPYLDLHGAVLVRDHEARHYRNSATIRKQAADEGIRLGYEPGGLFVRRGHVFPGLERVEVQSLEAFVEGDTDADAMLVSAETGAVVTMVYPEFSVIVPQGTNILIPVVFAVQDAPELQRILDRWIQIREDDGTVDQLYRYWVLGKSATDQQRHRWSVIRDVLGWVE
jgi:ABC-type amino acid transport substrate-binding protein